MTGSKSLRNKKISFDDPMMQAFFDEDDISTSSSTKPTVPENPPIKEDEIEPVDFEDEEPEAEQKAEGKSNKKGGLYDYEIEQMMEPYKKDGFIGVISSDEVSKLPPKKKMGFVMNLDPSNKPGSHWVAVYIDSSKDKTIEYYDSYGEDPSSTFMKQIKALVEKINPDTYLKFKVNKIVDQRANSDTCGFFAEKFLIDRFDGIPFKECTGYSNVKNGERDIREMKEKYERFGYI